MLSRRMQQSKAVLPGGRLLRLRASSLGLADDTRVSTWPDESGGGFDFVQATGVQQPLFCKTNYPDNLPFVCWDHWAPGNSNYREMVASTLPVDRRSFTLFMVLDICTIYRTGYILRTSADLTFIFECITALITAYYAGGANNTTYTPPANRRIAIVATSSASGVNIYCDGFSNVFSFGLAASGTATGLKIGDSAGIYKGRVYELALWPRVLSNAEIQQAFGYGSLNYDTGFTLIPPGGRAIFDGDSVTEGVGALRNSGWPDKIRVSANWLTYNYAVTGQTLTTMISQQAAPNKWANSSNWLFILGGFNDLSAAATGVAVEGRLNTYCTAAIAAGYSKSHIVTFTLSMAGFTTERDSANTLIRANYTGYAGWLVDVAADAQLGCVTGTPSFNVPGNFVDGVHPTDSGYFMMASLIRSTVTGLPF